MCGIRHAFVFKPKIIHYRGRALGSEEKKADRTDSFPSPNPFFFFFFLNSKKIKNKKCPFFYLKIKKKKWGGGRFLGLIWQPIVIPPLFFFTSFKNIK
jgi:hypothetical protein